MQARNLQAREPGDLIAARAGGRRAGHSGKAEAASLRWTAMGSSDSPIVLAMPPDKAAGAAAKAAERRGLAEGNADGPQQHLYSADRGGPGELGVSDGSPALRWSPCHGTTC